MQEFEKSKTVNASSDQVFAFLSDVNVHNAEFANGAIRGQLAK